MSEELLLLLLLMDGELTLVTAGGVRPVKLVAQSSGLREPPSGVRLVSRGLREPVRGGR